MGRLVNDLKTFVLLAVLGAILVAVGDQDGTSSAGVGLLLGLAVAGYSNCFSDRTALRSAHARPLSGAEAPQSYRIIGELASDAGIPMPRVYVTPDVQPNAFATGRNERHAGVAVTAGILDVLDTEELRGCWPMSSLTCATTRS